MNIKLKQYLLERLFGIKPPSKNRIKIKKLPPERTLQIEEYNEWARQIFHEINKIK